MSSAYELQNDSYSFHPTYPHGKGDGWWWWIDIIKHTLSKHFSNAQKRAASSPSSSTFSSSNGSIWKRFKHDAFPAAGICLPSTMAGGLMCACSPPLLCSLPSLRIAIDRCTNFMLAARQRVPLQSSRAAMLRKASK